MGWGAGSFDASYVLSLTPTKQNNQLVDNQVMQKCLIDVWASTVSTASAGGSSAASKATVPNVSITPVVIVTVAPSGKAGTVTTAGTSTVDMSTAMSGTDGGDLLTATGHPTATGGGGGGSLETATIASNMTATGTASGIPLVTTSGSSSMGQEFNLIMAVIFSAVTVLCFR